MNTPLIRNLQQVIAAAVQQTFEYTLSPAEINLSTVPDNVAGDLSFPCFPLARPLRNAPVKIAARLADAIHIDSVHPVAVGPYLNFTLHLSRWLPDLVNFIHTSDQPERDESVQPETIIIEYSSPNTNKPQHLGHVRNNVLGESMAAILAAVGHRVTRIVLFNNRGIHICQSMLAWQRDPDAMTPADSGIKGDHLVGEYYVRFRQHLQDEKQEWLKSHDIDPATLSAEEAQRLEGEFMEQSEWNQAARTMLRQWEDHDPDVRRLWETMNGWVYEGFEQTYERLGIHFDRTDYESENYLLGKQIVEEALEQRIVYRKEDGSVWIGVEEGGSTEKLLLRRDGTSVYITQDIGTVIRRRREINFDRHIYVVANEQNHHFKVLFATMKKLGYDWADRLEHLAYGMVNLPSGKLKSREGTRVDADNLMDTMQQLARTIMTESERRQEFTPAELDSTADEVGLGAIKYFLLRVSAAQDVLYDPEKSLDMTGMTGPYVQYTHARTASLARKGDFRHDPDLVWTVDSDEERELLLTLLSYASVVQTAATQRNPSRVAQFLFDLAKAFNKYWHEHPILKEADAGVRAQRLELAVATGIILKRALNLLGIAAPEKI